MNKSSFLVEILIKKPCKKCLVQPCCITKCNDLYKWYVRHRILIELNDIIIAILAIISMIYLLVLNWIGILSEDSANFYADKIKKVVDKNL